MLDKLTLGDLADIEDVTGASVNGIDLENPPVKFALALYWVIRRKENPKYTYDQARATPLSELDEFRKVLGKSANPTKPLPPGKPVDGDGGETTD